MLVGIKLKELGVFFSFLFKSKKKDVFIHLLITFLLPLIPYIWLSILILKDHQNNASSYFGDGSIIALCIGIICAYFYKSHEFKNSIEKKTQQINNLITIVIYIILTLLFVQCQLDFSRSKEFIFVIFFISLVVLVYAMIFSLSYTFYDYNDFEDFKNDRLKKEGEHIIKETQTSESNIQI